LLIKLRGDIIPGYWAFLVLPLPLDPTLENFTGPKLTEAYDGALLFPDSTLMAALLETRRGGKVTGLLVFFTCSWNKTNIQNVGHDGLCPALSVKPMQWSLFAKIINFPWE